MENRLLAIYCYHCKKTTVSVLANPARSAPLTASCFSYSNSSTSDRPPRWRRSGSITATCTAMPARTAAWRETLTVPGMAFPAPGITQQVHMQRGKLLTQGKVSTVQKNYHFEGLFFFPFCAHSMKTSYFLNLNKPP